MEILPLNLTELKIQALLTELSECKNSEIMKLNYQALEEVLPYSKNLLGLSTSTKQSLLNKLLSDQNEYQIKMSPEFLYRLMSSLILESSDSLTSKDFKIGNYNFEDLSELKSVILSKILKSSFSHLTQAHLETLKTVFKTFKIDKLVL